MNRRAPQVSTQPVSPLPLLEDLRAVLRPVAEARSFPASAYTDQGWLDLEVASLFLPGFCAASEASIPAPGAWTRVALPGQNLVIARASDLTARALRAVCRHRGALLFDGDRGRCPTLDVTCPYHGWAYDLVGHLRRAPGMPEGFDRASHGLEVGEVTSRFGQLFAHVPSPDARPLAASVSEGPPWLDGLDPWMLRRAREVTWEVGANWKLIVQNFQESHHFPIVHPGLERLTPFAGSRSVVGSEAWLGGVMTLSDEAETVSLSGSRRGRPFIVVPDQRREVRDAWIFPNLLTSLQPDYLLTYKLIPLSVARTQVTGEIYLHKAAPSDAEGEADLFGFWDQTNAEDKLVCERQQQGMAWRGFRPSAYASSEDGMHAFDRVIADRLLCAITQQGDL